jgi:hypothetical protein
VSRENPCKYRYVSNLKLGNRTEKKLIFLVTDL